MSGYAPSKRPLCPACKTNRILTRGSKVCWSCGHGGWQPSTDPPALPADPLPTGGSPEPEPAQPVIDSFERAWAVWEHQIGQARCRYVPPPPRWQGGRKRYVVIPDLHSPFHEPSMLADLIVRERHADAAILLGDVDDAYALSRFLQYKPIPFGESWATTTAVFEAIAGAFPEVIVLVGNHDARLEKQLLSRLTVDMVEAVRYLTGGTLCPLTALVKRYPNVKIARHELPNGESVDWFTTVGDAWLGHPEKFSRVLGSALRSVEEWLEDRAYELGLDRYRLIVLGHTHGAMLAPWRSNKLLMEAGCLCQVQGYMTTPKIAGRPQRRGYGWFEQENGVTDLNSVGFHNFDFDAQQRGVA